MRRRIVRRIEDSREGDSPNPLRRRVFFQDLPPDVRMAVLQGIKFHLSKEHRPEHLGLFDLDDLLDQEADDLINRHNVRRTIREWLAFAESGR